MTKRTKFEIKETLIFLIDYLIKKNPNDKELKEKAKKLLKKYNITTGD